MSEARPYLTVPGTVWRRDPTLNRCREDSITVFKLIAEASNRDWRIEVSPSNHAFSVRQCFLDPDRFRRWSEERINRALAELRARGCLILATSDDREWLEIPDRLAYCKGHKRQEPLKPPEQIPLPMETEAPLFALPPPRIPVRGEEEKKLPPPPAHASESVSLREALALAENQAIAADFAEMVFTSWHARQGRDASGVCIPFSRYLAKRWAREAAEWKTETHRDHPKRQHHERHPRNPRSRNTGTANDGDTDQYANG